MKFAKLTAAAAVIAMSMATSAFAFDPENTECIAPANPGGGWDFTCRQVGKTLQDLSLVPGTTMVAAETVPPETAPTASAVTNALTNRCSFIARSL